MNFDLKSSSKPNNGQSGKRSPCFHCLQFRPHQAQFDAMQPPAFLPHLPVTPRTYKPRLPQHTCLSATCPQRRPPSATLSLPQDDGRMRSITGGLLHTEQTKRKIGDAVIRRAAARRERLQNFLLSIQGSKTQSDPRDENHIQHRDEKEKDDPITAPKKPRRQQSPESRAKISAALKGRPKSPAHREALRARFEGEGNPMYGRKLSKESRAKISAKMVGRTRKKRETPHITEPSVNQQAITDLRDKAAKSRLFNETRKTKTTMPKRRKLAKELQDQAEAEEIEELLTIVASLDKPPENVAKTLENNRRRREKDVKVNQNSVRCERCKATGYVKCPACVGAFGVASARCEECFGAGAVFCETCQGVGELEEGGVC